VRVAAIASSASKRMDQRKAIGNHPPDRMSGDTKPESWAVSAGKKDKCSGN
jgi:hypothetical protein